MNRKLGFDNRLCYERDVARHQALHQRKLEQVGPTCLSPSRVFLDSNAPKPQPHLVTNGKRQQIERDRQLDIYHQNQRLANKMDQIMNRQENIVLAASSSPTRVRLPQRQRTKVALMPSVPTAGNATSRVQTPSPISSPRYEQLRKSIHTPAHTHMPGIRLDSTQTPLLDCHLSPEFAMGRGDACKKPSLVNRAVQKRKQTAIDVENRRLKDRLAHLKPYYNTKKWDGEWQEHAHKFGHLRQDGTVGYLLPSPKTPSKRQAPPSRGGYDPPRGRGFARDTTRGLPSLGNKNRSNASRAGRLKELQNQNRRSKVNENEGTRELEYEEDGVQFRELSPCLLLEATTRQGVEVTVDELQLELTRSDIAELGDRGLLIRGFWKDGIFGELLANHETLVQVAQIVDDLEIMIKLETVSQVPKVGNIPSLSTLLTDDELQKLLVGVVQQLRFQEAPTPCNPALLISWCLPIRGPSDTRASEGSSSDSPQERLRPRTCPSTLVSESDCHRQSEIQDDGYQADFTSECMTFRGEADTDPLEIDWAIRFKIAALLNMDGRRWRTVLRKGSSLYLISSWFEEETCTLTIKTSGVGQSEGDEVPSVNIAYNVIKMEELLRQLEGGTLTVHALLEQAVASVIP